MGKTKSKSKTKYADEEEVDADVAEVEDADVAEVEDADVADVDDADAAEVEAEADDDGDDRDRKSNRADEDSIDETPSSPPARITKTALALILLNWIAAPLFLYVAFMDHTVRVQHSFKTMLNYVQIWGLPLRSEDSREGDKYTPLSLEMRPRMNLSHEQLSASLKGRPGTNKTFTEKFMAVDEPVPLRLQPRDMIPILLRDVFEGHPDGTVPTLEDEIERLKTTLPGKIEEAAKEAKEKLKTDDDKRLAIRKTLLPIAWDVWQVKKLDERIAKAKGADLDTLLDDALQRRMYYDILAPINIFRPGNLSDVNNYKIEKLADLGAYNLDKIKDFMLERLNASIADQYDLEVHIGKDYFNAEQPDAKALNRSSVEKRQKIGFILFALSQVSAPTLDRKLYPKGIERAQIVSGLHEFTNASIHYVRALGILEERIVTAVVADRQGWLVELKGKKGQTSGFGDEYELEIDRLVKLVEHIDSADKRLADLKGQRDQFQKIYDQRALQHKETLDKLLKSRSITETEVKKLRELQDQLHTALVELSDAAERNFGLEAEIRAIELRYLNLTSKKGGKK